MLEDIYIDTAVPGRPQVHAQCCGRTLVAKTRRPKQHRPATARYSRQLQAAQTTGVVSRGYTEEMAHFCHCIRTENYGSPKEGGLRCDGEVAMADAIMALTAKLAMAHKKRIEFKPEWFDPDDPAVPETDPQVTG